ncbi:MAG: peptidoglycan-associated lipoprotein [Thiothrix sp.]|nr:MAG: peptidoglycan-associated lipoprotein [Thiothrix sp.]
MKYKLIIVLVAVIAFTACGKKNTRPDGTTQGNEQQAGNGAVTSGTSMDAGTANATASDLDPFEDPASPLSKRVIYFDYDSTEVKDIDAVNAHAQYLADNPGAVVRLEGHADERGTREYNVALAEERGLAIKRLMAFQPLQTEQMSVVGFGEERPVAFGHNEKSWQLNRRVEIIYESK